MAMIHELPYLGTIRGGVALRRICLKVYSYAQINRDNGGDFGATVLVPFIKNQIELGSNDHGYMSDGLFLNIPGLDPRKEFYDVHSSLRMWGNAEQKEAFNAFCWFLINEFQVAEPASTTKKA